jgi:hypothetical protein
MKAHTVPALVDRPAQLSRVETGRRAPCLRDMLVSGLFVTPIRLLAGAAAIILVG